MAAFEDNQYPVSSSNLNKKSLEFWHDLGMVLRNYRDINQLSRTLLSAPVERKITSDYKKDFTDIGKGLEGEITQSALENIDLLLEEGSELVVRAFEMGSWPQDYFDINLNVVSAEDVERKHPNYNGSILLTQVPPEHEEDIKIGEHYDFAVIGTGSEYIIGSGDYPTTKV